MPELVASQNLATIAAMIEALVLAGGASTRMGAPKPVLPAPDGRPFVVRIVDTLREAGLHRITVVTGHHHDAVAAACAPLLAGGVVQCVRNPDPSRGQLSSLLAGMEAVVSGDTPGLLVTLVDIPLVRTDTVRRLLSVFAATAAPVVRPMLRGRHGHPVIFSRETFAALRAAGEDGARGVIRAYGSAVENVAVEDEGCLVDVDTPEDYANLTVRGRP